MRRHTTKGTEGWRGFLLFGEWHKRNLIYPTHNSPATTNRPQEAALGHLNRFVVIAGCPSF
jgi:hypothetical protein